MKECDYGAMKIEDEDTISKIFFKPFFFKMPPYLSKKITVN